MKLKYVSFLIVPILTIITILSCSKRITVRSDINPTYTPSKIVTYSAAIVIPEGLKNYSKTVKPSGFIGSGNTYKFDIGHSLCPALRRSAASYFEKIIEINSMPREGLYERIVKYSYQDIDLEVFYYDDLFKTGGRANCSIFLIMEVFDSNLNLLNEAIISGNGSTSKDKDEFSDSHYFAQAVERAIQEVTNNSARLFNSGFTEQQ